MLLVRASCSQWKHLWANKPCIKPMLSDVRNMCKHSCKMWNLLIPYMLTLNYYLLLLSHQDGWKWFLPASRSSLNLPGNSIRALNLSFGNPMVLYIYIYAIVSFTAFPSNSFWGPWWFGLFAHKSASWHDLRAGLLPQFSRSFWHLPGPSIHLLNCRA